MFTVFFFSRVLFFNFLVNFFFLGSCSGLSRVLTSLFSLGVFSEMWIWRWFSGRLLLTHLFFFNLHDHIQRYILNLCCMWRVTTIIQHDVGYSRIITWFTFHFDSWGCCQSRLQLRLHIASAVLAWLFLLAAALLLTRQSNYHHLDIPLQFTSLVL